MADVQLEKNGFTRIANPILEQIAGLKLNGTQFSILLSVWRYTYGFHRKQHKISLTFLSKATGRNRTQIKREVDRLIDAKILLVEGESNYTQSREIKFNKDYEQWMECKLKSSQSAKKHTVGVKEHSELDDTQECKLKSLQGCELISSQGCKLKSSQGCKLISLPRKKDLKDKDLKEKDLKESTKEKNICDFKGKCIHPDKQCQRHDIDCEIDECPILEVWDHYCLTMKDWYKPRTFDKGRKTIISSRLKEYSKEELMQAIYNISQSTYHVGEHKNNNKFYAKPEFIFRNDKKVEEWLNYNPAKNRSSIRDRYQKAKERDEKEGGRIL